MTIEHADPDRMETLDDVRAKHGLSASAEYFPGRPGAMAREALWVALAYQAMMDGEGDNLGNGYTLLTVDATDRVNWDLLPDTDAVGLHINNDGLIYGFELTREEADTLATEQQDEQSRCPGCGDLPIESDCTEHEYHCGKCHHGYNSDDVFPN